MANLPDKPTIYTIPWINGQTKLNSANLTSGVNNNLTHLKTAIDGIIDNFGEYLPLSGGTVTGPTTFNDSIRVVDDAHFDSSVRIVDNLNVYGYSIFAHNVAITAAVPTAASHATRKDYVDNLVASVKTNAFQVVQSLPQTGEEGIIYLVPKANTDYYTQYIWEGNSWLNIGDTQIDLSGYLPLTGGTINGNLNVNGTTTLSAGGQTSLVVGQNDIVAWKTLTAKSALNVDGLIYAGGHEIRFPTYVEFKDNTDQHNVIMHVNQDYVNFWRQATYLSNIKISAANDANPPIMQTNFDREGGWVVFGRGATFNAAAEYNGLIWVGGREIRFPDYVEFKDNTNAHNTVLKIDQNYINAEKTTTFKQDVNVDGLIYAGGKEIRFPDYLNFTDNTDAHNTILSVFPNRVQLNKHLTYKATNNNEYNIASCSILSQPLIFLGDNHCDLILQGAGTRPFFKDWNGMSKATQIALLSDIPDASKMTETTWSALKVLRDGGNLVPGMQYRITDYQCTTTAENTSSAGHQFDIIVVADSASVLNENARAALHAGDTYFTNNKLEAWQLKYCLDNDASRFAWADATNGKGVIYWMRDEFGNEAPYDFKNVWFERDIYEETGTTEPPSEGSGTLIQGKEVFTFNAWDYDNDRCVDASLINKKQVIDDYANVCEYNSIKPYHKGFVGSDSMPQYLNDIVLLGMFTLLDEYYFNISRNHFEEDTFNITLNNDCYMNFFGSSCDGISLGSSSGHNKFDSGCHDIELGVGSSANIFGVNATGHCGKNCSSNIFDGQNNFDLGEGCDHNHVGEGTSINLGNYCSHNVFKLGSSNITFGNSCNCNAIGSNCSSIWLGDYCERNVFHDNCSWVSIGTMGSPINYCRYNEIDNGAYSLQIICSDTSASYSNQLQYIHVHSGIKGAVGTAKTITVPDRNLDHVIEYYPTGSETILV